MYLPEKPREPAQTHTEPRVSLNKLPAFAAVDRKGRQVLRPRSADGYLSEFGSIEKPTWIVVDRLMSPDSIGVLASDCLAIAISRRTSP